MNPDRVLSVYVGENYLFVRVPPPDNPIGKAEWWATVQKFYRIVAGELGTRPLDIWDSYLGYALVPISFLNVLKAHFSVHLLSADEFYNTSAGE